MPRPQPLEDEALRDVTGGAAWDWPNDGTAETGPGMPPAPPPAPDPPPAPP